MRGCSKKPLELSWVTFLFGCREKFIIGFVSGLEGVGVGGLGFILSWGQEMVTGQDIRGCIFKIQTDHQQWSMNSHELNDKV